MNSMLHNASCAVWETGALQDCQCYRIPAWRIRKEPGELFAWRIWRYSFDQSGFEHVMRCSTFEGAVELVNQFIWLRNNAITRSEIV